MRRHAFYTPLTINLPIEFCPTWYAKTISCIFFYQEKANLIYVYKRMIYLEENNINYNFQSFSLGVNFQPFSLGVNCLLVL